MENLKDYLDELVAKNNTATFIKDDPVQFPHRYSDVRDIEIVSFLVATIAWGNRKMILNSANNMLAMMGKSPYDFVMSGGWEKLDDSKCVHRTFFGRDLKYYCKGLSKAYQMPVNSLENVFYNEEHDVWRGIQNFRDLIAEANGCTSKHISNPSCCEPNKGSACKRLHMALRWLVRNDGMVDLGIWKRLNPRDLMIPLDVHVARVSRDLGLIERKSNDRQTVEMLTAKLREFDPADPVKYDFALFGVELM
ncbi:MAG: TIGR02757 family protein [Bacteroidales bacterium]|nr:TIGR02757 family protein [Bacteroidales bacterium]